MAMRSNEHWYKLIELIERAKTDEALGKTLRHGSPREVTTVLKEAGFEMDDLGLIFEDLEVIADRNSLRYWSPLA